jgi:ECF sigma factor
MSPSFLIASNRANPRPPELLPPVYDQLRRLAAAKMAQQPPGQTLQATALVHEAYLRLVGSEPQAWIVGGEPAPPCVSIQWIPVSPAQLIERVPGLLIASLTGAQHDGPVRGCELRLPLYAMGNPPLRVW